MIRTPAHKQTDPAKAAGQIKTLGEYIKQKTAHDPKKLSFEEWARKSGVYYHLDARSGDWTHEKALRAAWDAGRENM